MNIGPRLEESVVVTIPIATRNYPVVLGIAEVILKHRRACLSPKFLHGFRRTGRHMILGKKAA